MVFSIKSYNSSNQKKSKWKGKKHKPLPTRAMNWKEPEETALAKALIEASQDPIKGGIWKWEIVFGKPFEISFMNKLIKSCTERLTN